MTDQPAAFQLVHSSDTDALLTLSGAWVQAYDHGDFSPLSGQMHLWTTKRLTVD